MRENVIAWREKRIEVRSRAIRRCLDALCRPHGATLQQLEDRKIVHKVSCRWWLVVIVSMMGTDRGWQGQGACNPMADDVGLQFDELTEKQSESIGAIV